MSERWPLGQRQLSNLLSSTGSPETDLALDHVRRSRNLLLLCGLKESIEINKAYAAQAARFNDNYAALSAIDSAYRQDSAQLMAHPHVSAWLATCLKHVMGSGDKTPLWPLWVDLAHLGAIAIAAAARTGVEIEAAVPVHRGQIFIPSYGLIDVDSDSTWELMVIKSLPGATVQIAGSAQIFSLDQLGKENSGGLDMRHLETSCNGLTIDVELDDLDPYRDCHQLGASGRISIAEVESWRRILTEAWGILATRHHHQATSIARDLVTLVPLIVRGLSGISATSRHALGAVALTPPRDGIGLASTLVHELQHAKLSLALELLPPIEVTLDKRFYSPWREDPRPLIGLIHGIYAAIGVAGFWRIETVSGQADSVAAFQYARARKQIEVGLDSLSRLGPLTDASEILVEVTKNIATSLADTAVPSYCARLAEDATLDHAVRWRLLNLRPADRDIDRLVACWKGGMPCPPPSSVANWSERDESFTEDARLRMAYAWLLNNRPVDVFAPGLADTSRADLLLLRGEYEEAATAYDHDIRSTPHLAEAWAGLAVASRGKADQAAATLRQRPELVRAVYARLAVASGTISPLDIARWIARSSIKPNE